MSPEQRWTRILDELELRGEGALAGVPFDSGDPGPLPESLLERAYTVLAGLNAERDRVAAASADVKRQLSATRRAVFTPASAPAAYLDIAG